MKADELLVHCYAERKDGQWQAFCLDFDLAAQAETFGEVRAKLDAMLDDYVAEATVGEDRAFGEQLLTRRAPWWVWVRYYLCQWGCRGARHRAFREPLPVVLAPHLRRA